MDLFKSPIEFEWDKGNRDKNLVKHRVVHEECEEVFFDPHKRIFKPGSYESEEERHLLAGKTRDERLLFVVFAIRRNKVRVISARDLNRRERHLYEKKP